MNRIHYLPLLCSLIVLSCDFHAEKSKTAGIPDETEFNLFQEESEPLYNIFGIDESLNAKTHVIQRNENLSSILRRNGLSSHLVHDLGNASSDVFDVRRIRAGRPLHLYFKTDMTDEDRQIAYIVYEENHTEFIRFELGDSVFVTRNSKPVEVRTRKVSGEIRGSVYQTLQEIDVDPQLTHRLADVFAWQVDFYRIQPGDHFTVLFEEKIVEDRVSEIGRIKAAIFNHRNTDYYAFHYRQNDSDEYFDEQGNSMRRQFMAAPLDYTRISSRFTNRRYHPILRRNMPHHGTDYAAPVGTPIRAVGDGVITVASYDRNNGNYIRIRHNSIYETGYLHMSRFAEGMRSGTEVKQGQIIGYVGATGLATGPHLCFRFWEHGRPVNPQRIDLPPADPIKAEHRGAFLNRKVELLTRLDIDDSTIQRPFTFAMDIGYNGILMGKTKMNDVLFDL